MRETEGPQTNIMRRIEEIPTQTYIGFTFGSILLSAFFFLIGRRSTALFVGQWAPTLGILALVSKLLHPSGEYPIEQIRQTAAEIGSKVSR